MKNRFKDKKKKAGLDASHFITKRGADKLITQRIKEISFHTLRDHLVDIHKSRGETIKEAIDNFMNDELPRLREPTKKEN